MKEFEEVERLIFEDEPNWKSLYDKLVSGEYGAFEIWSSDGNIEGYRGFRKECGSTGVYPTYREAIEAALKEFANGDEEADRTA